MMIRKTRVELESAYETGSRARGSGAYWFTPDTLRFFSGIVYPGDIYYLPAAGGWLFITSEQGPHGPRAYTVRRMDDAGRIHDVGGFMSHPTKASARKALAAVTVEQLRDMFNLWRYESKGNGATVTIYAPDGRTAFLQGDDAAEFMDRAEKTTDTYTDSDLCKEYADLLTETPTKG